ncbi:hypothetical protein IWQ61_003889 [Dispira simplex]|nr:hypothetical protein IWQ61_003889 [Dispira simplex]
MASQSDQRLIVIAVNPGSSETPHILQWVLDNFLDSRRDRVQLVSGLCLESDLDAVSLGINAPDISAYLVNLEEESESDITKQLTHCARLLTQANVRTECLVVKGHSDVRDIVVNYINDVKADALVVGSRDLGVWKRLWLGSFSDFCVHSVHCPVVVVKPSSTSA